MMKVTLLSRKLLARGIIKFVLTLEMCLKLSLKKFSKLVALILFFGSLIHVLVLYDKEKNPAYPETKHYDQNLMDIDFPLVLKICSFYGSTRPVNDYPEFGYENQDKFFQGISMFNSSIVGWNGHTENGSTIGNVEGKRK